MTAPRHIAVRRAVVAAGHLGDTATARHGLTHADPVVRAVALGALDRLRDLAAVDLDRAIGDPDPAVRRRAAELAARYGDVDLRPALADVEPSVVEVALWACGEREHVADDVLSTVIALTTADDPIVRESAVAALGAIGDDRGLPAILSALGDTPHIRRRAVLALAPFEGPEVEAAIDRALADRDWQVRQGAEDLRRVADGI